MFETINKMSVKAYSGCNLNCVYCHQLGDYKYHPAVFNDFKNMYAVLDAGKAYEDMKRETKYHDTFIPGFATVAAENIKYKREKISKVFANMMNVEFDETLFAQNPMAYIDMFEPLVAENNLNLFIATDEQAKQFRKIVEQMLENKKVNQNS